MTGRARGRSSRPIVLAFLATMAGVAAAIASAEAEAESIDPRRPNTFVVGAPRGPGAMTRVDARRLGLTHDPLPSADLHVAWRKTIGLGTEQPALTLADGTLAFVSTRGDVVFLADDGQDLGRVSAFAAGSAGSAIALSDGSVAFATSGGDVVAVHPSMPRPRFVVHVGGDRNGKAAPLPMDDGGLVVSTGNDLVLLDGAGGIRARTTLPEPTAAPLLSNGARVLAITSSGAVHAWNFGEGTTRLGSFGAPLDGGAALDDAGHLLAVTEAGQVMDLDLKTGAVEARATSSQGLYLGPPSLRPQRAPGASTATLLLYGATRSFVITMDASGQEIRRAPVGPTRASAATDAGAIPVLAPPHSGPLVDRRGTSVAVTPEGHVATVSPEGAVDGFGEALCTPTRRTSGVAGVTSLGPQTFAVTCEGGVVVRIDGPGAVRTRRSRTAPLPSVLPRVPSAPSARPAPRTAPDAVPEGEPDEDD